MYGWIGLAGAGGFVLFLVVATVALLLSPTTPGSRRNWLVLVEGNDGRLSTSKFQWFAWSAVISGSFVAVFAARAFAGLGATTSPNVPANVLIALGFSATTMATAKGVTTLYSASGRIVKSSVQPGAANANVTGGLLTDDTGITDLSKVQLVTWTVIALGVYVYSLSVQIAAISGTDMKGMHPNLGLPDIDGALMVLTGLSQGGYLGKKLIEKTTPILQSLVPSTVAPGPNTFITVYGTNFGDKPGTDSVVKVGGASAPVIANDWSDGKIKAQFPPTAPGDVPWGPSGTKVDVSVVVDGTESDNTLQVTIA